ncbi:putative ELMO/CED-12 family protein [Blattamonas nauphoetae]|uniref:ELMO/CED-12 family protein n=1 Tax=Blattamonas nauphoetae TaxID=2049346 RepID=A0ABQ9X4K5_9EUKA|nr:putative ELMO/CED-12 family protein [Blattamonas nauphoetae]
MSSPPPENQEDIWNNIPTTEFSEEGQNVTHQEPESPMTYEKARSLLVDFDAKSGLSAIAYKPHVRRFCFGPAVLTKANLDSVIQFMCLSKVDVSASTDSHAMLFSVFSLLTGDTGCTLTGQHWERVGFQGTDPRTDFRSCGLAALLQMLYLPSVHPKCASVIYKLSQIPSISFPYAVVSINLTAHCLNALRNGKVNKILNKQNDPFDTIMKLHAGAFLKFYSIWKSGSYSIVNVADVLQTILKSVVNNPSLVVETFEKASQAQFDEI